MSTNNQVNRGGISAALGLTAPTVYHTGAAAPPTTTSGTDTTPATTEEFVAEVFVPVNHTSTGVAILNGSAAAGNLQAVLYDSNGKIVALTASTAQSGTAAYQQIAWASAPKLKGPAKYFVGLQCSSTSARFRTHILGNFATTKKTGGTYGTFVALTVPTTFTTGVGPVADIY